MIGLLQLGLAFYTFYIGMGNVISGGSWMFGSWIWMGLGFLTSGISTLTVSRFTYDEKVPDRRKIIFALISLTTAIVCMQLVELKTYEIRQQNEKSLFIGTSKLYKNGYEKMMSISKNVNVENLKNESNYGEINDYDHINMINSNVSDSFIKKIDTDNQNSCIYSFSKRRKARILNDVSLIYKNKKITRKLTIQEFMEKEMVKAKMNVSNENISSNTYVDNQICRIWENINLNSMSEFEMIFPLVTLVIVQIITSLFTIILEVNKKYAKKRESMRRGNILYRKCKLLQSMINRIEERISDCVCCLIGVNNNKKPDFDVIYFKETGVEIKIEENSGDWMEVSSVKG